MQTVNSWLVAGFSAAVLIDFASPVILAVVLARRCRASWRYWLYGILVFLLFQGITRIPAMVAYQGLPSVNAQLQEQGTFFWAFLVFAALTAGLFEEGGRWLAFRFVVPARERQRNSAMMMGAGHGGLEAIGVGTVQLLALLGYLIVTLGPPAALNASQLEAAQNQFAALRGWEPLMGAWERLAAQAIQIAFSVMVLQAFLRGGRWWWYALAGHAWVDFSTVALMTLLPASWGSAKLFFVEGLATLYAVLAIWFIVAMKDRYVPQVQDVPAISPPADPSAPEGASRD